LYISISKRDKKDYKGTSYYIYLCESKRENGKVKTKKTHLYTFSEGDLSSLDGIRTINIQVKAKLFTTMTDEKLKKIMNDLWQKLSKEQENLFKESNFWKQMFEAEYNAYKEFKSSNSSYNFVTTKKSSADEEIKQELIKVGYKALCKKYHPEMSTGDEEKFKILAQVYEELKAM